jgi:glycosyltransferase involved in cell wall biosynthesis
MRIGIDISTVLNHGKDVGAGRYIINLVKNLLETDTENTYVLTGRYTTDENLHLIRELDHARTARPEQLELKLFRTTVKKLALWDKFGFPPLEMLGFKADILHCPDYLIPPTFNKKIILTIHDLAFIRFPHFNFDWFIKKYKKLVKKNSLLSKRVIADSNSTRNDIIQFFGTKENKIGVVHLAAEEIFRKLDASELDKEILPKFKITKKYILSVGTIEPRKNYATLIKAYNLFKLKYLSSGFKTGSPSMGSGSDLKNKDYQLVIVGRTGWLSEEAFAEYEKSPYKEDIIFVGRISDIELVQIYNHAELFVYPSVFEGFGLPVLEALQCGLVSLASNTSSIPELIHDRHLLFNPADEAEIAAKIAEFLNKDNLKTELSQNALNNASRFSWKKTAKKTLDIYRDTIRE